ncbi:MAG TPA: hypothetical protein VHY35_18365 [Stellaceae bacterium]|jgi:hypothetical protein|nr:hypothetical protein [Stellaceae bacterium]
MTLDEAKKALINVLQRIQAVSGEECPALNGSVIPAKQLPKFDSTVWPAATTLVARDLGVSIPNNVHIFGGQNGAPLLTIDQTAALICKKWLPREQTKAA